MNKNINQSRGKLISALSLVLVIILAYALLFSPSSALAANRVVKSDEVKVFVGSSRSTNIVKAKAYINEREDYLDKLAGINADDTYSAVIVLNDYYSADDIQQFAEKESVDIKRIYLWIPGETGRASLSVSNNDITGAIIRSYERAKSHEGTEDFGGADKDYIRIINGNYGIFGITVESYLERLKGMKDKEIVEFVDVKYSDEGEKAAANRGVNIQYIELPYKPDGAL